MPLPMVHLSIAKNIIIAGFDVKSLPKFYLGVISPDAIHMRPNVDKKEKYKTHMKPTGTDLWNDVDEDDFIEFILSFIKSHQNNVDIDFLQGYAIHILTDMYWTKRIYYPFEEKYENDPNPIQKEREAYYNDTDLIDFSLYYECPWREEIWNHLSKAEGSDFLDLLSANEINMWNKRTINWYEDNKHRKYNPLRYIHKPEVDEFIQFCSSRIDLN